MAARKVVIVQRRLTHYRVPLFTGLRAALADRGILLNVLVGRGTREEEEKRDTGELHWVTSLPTRYFAGGRLCWQPFEKHLVGADLVIVTQENKLINNHLLLLRPHRSRLAFWGHGANLQSGNPNGLREQFKRWTTNRVDWWFAYTQLSADLVAETGFPRNRITILNNAVDTLELRRLRSEITAEETRAVRRALGVGEVPVGVFVGSLYADKRLDFLLEAVQAVRCDIPDFCLLLIGDGPERDKVRAWCGSYPWVRWVGARRDRDKVVHVAMAHVMLNPGLVGLGILDSFALGVPMITTDTRQHGPEVAYLRHGRNGIMTANDIGTFARAVVALLSDRSELSRLRTGCLASGGEFTLDDTVRRFTDGIELALADQR